MKERQNGKIRSIPDRTLSGFQTLPRSQIHRRKRANSIVQAFVNNVTDRMRRDTWLVPLLVMLLVGAIYMINPSRSNPVHPLLFLSYPVPGTDQYGKGPRDIAFTVFYAFFFTFTREFMMQKLLRPAAIRAGITKSNKQKRFMEQLYTLIYFSVFGPFGLYNMSKLPIWYFDTKEFWRHYPHKTHNATFKAHYLLEAAYWLQQAVVLALRLEKPRSDFTELVFHHIITLALIALSYRFHFTWIGLCVYITMDVSDIFLALSKVLNYLDHPLGVPMFAFFVGVWGYLRHYLNLKFLWSVAFEMSTVGDFKLNWDTQQYKCWISQYITFALLAALQLVNAFWFFLILRIGFRFLVAGVKKDERSDDEDEDETSTGEDTPKTKKDD